MTWNSDDIIHMLEALSKAGVTIKVYDLVLPEGVTCCIKNYKIHFDIISKTLSLEEY